MRKLILGTISFLLIMPLTAAAYWQVANPLAHTKRKHLIKPKLGKTDYPQLYSHPRSYIFSLRKGLLKRNIERIARRCGWSVNWKAPYRYYLLINTKISGPNLPIIVNRLLNNYDTLSAKYNYKYRVVTISLKKKRRSRSRRGA